MTRRAIVGTWVHPIGIGCMPLSIEGRPREADAIRVIHAAIERGVSLFDTADVYCLGEDDLGHNERLLGRALRGRNGLLIATKGGVTRPGGGWGHDGRPEHLIRACERSLSRLALDRIPLYQLHAVDRAVPIEESVGALAQLRDQGKIGAIGISNVTRDELVRARSVAEIAAVQNRAGFYDREGLTDGVLEACEEHGIAFVAHSPLGSWKAGGIAHEPVLQEIARARGVNEHQVVLAWLLARSPCVIPIPGASRIASAIASAEAAAIALGHDEIARIDRSSGARV